MNVLNSPGLDWPFGDQSCHYANDLKHLPDIYKPESPSGPTVLAEKITMTSNSPTQHKAPTPALL